MVRCSRSWHWLAVTLLLSACGGLQDRAVIPSSPQSGGSLTDIPNSPPAIVEIP